MSVLDMATPRHAGISGIYVSRMSISPLEGRTDGFTHRGALDPSIKPPRIPCGSRSPGPHGSGAAQLTSFERPEGRLLVLHHAGTEPAGCSNWQRPVPLRGFEPRTSPLGPACSSVELQRLGKNPGVRRGLCSPQPRQEGQEACGSHTLDRREPIPVRSTPSGRERSGGVARCWSYERKGPCPGEDWRSALPFVSHSLPVQEA